MIEREAPGRRKHRPASKLPGMADHHFRGLHRPTCHPGDKLSRLRLKPIVLPNRSHVPGPPRLRQLMMSSLRGSRHTRMRAGYGRLAISSPLRGFFDIRQRAIRPVEHSQPMTLAQGPWRPGEGGPKEIDRPNHPQTWITLVDGRAPMCADGRPYRFGEPGNSMAPRISPHPRLLSRRRKLDIDILDCNPHPGRRLYCYGLQQAGVSASSLGRETSLSGVGGFFNLIGIIVATRQTRLPSTRWTSSRQEPTWQGTWERPLPPATAGNTSVQWSPSLESCISRSTVAATTAPRRSREDHPQGIENRRVQGGSLRSPRDGRIRSRTIGLPGGPDQPPGGQRLRADLFSRAAGPGSDDDEPAAR